MHRRMPKDAHEDEIIRTLVNSTTGERKTDDKP
jgi:hypothetical protein